MRLTIYITTINALEGSYINVKIVATAFALGDIVYTVHLCTHLKTLLDLIFVMVYCCTMI